MNIWPTHEAILLNQTESELYLSLFDLEPNRRPFGSEPKSDSIYHFPIDLEQHTDSVVCCSKSIKTC